jgi:hypothetical protein
LLSSNPGKPDIIVRKGLRGSLIPATTERGVIGLLIVKRNI